MPIKLRISLLTPKLTAKSTVKRKPKTRLTWLSQLSAFAILSALPYTAHSVVTDYSGAPIFKQGYVAARNVVRGPSGQPVYAQIDAYGDVISEIGEAVGAYENAEVMSAAAYRQTFTRYSALIAQYPSYRLSANGKRLYQLDLSGNDIQPALLTSKVNLNLPQDPGVSDSTTAVLLSAAGNVLFASNYNIAFRVAMFGLDNGSGGISDAGPGNDKDIIRSPGDQLLGPMTGSMVGYNTYTQFAGIVSETGRYIIEGRIAPCPGFSYSFNGFVFLDLYYRSFNPRAKQPMQSWGMTQSTRDTCTGYSAMDGIGGNDGLAADLILLEDAFAFEFNNNFIVDLLLITGTGNQLSNTSQGGGSIGIGATTEYTYTAPSFNKTTTDNLDLDGDGIVDTQVLVTIDDLETTNPELAVAVAVYLGGKPKQIDPVTNKVINEDLRRQLDIDPDLSHQGLLSQISAADLVDTDILTYRESTGERYSERNKLQGNALTGIGEGGSFSAGIEANGTIYFNTPVLWTSLSTYLGESTFNSPTGSARTYQAASGNSTGASNPNAWKDALRPGEYLNTYFINRRSGYLGMSRVQIDSNANQALLGTQSPQAELLPPNLKIRVERRSKVEAGITKGETREQLVGFEGSGLTSDTLLVITTEWYAEDGSPLPDDLPGYTARLAKVVKSSGLDRLDDAAPGNFVSQFAITPGTHTKTIFIPEDNRPEHFYVHISGQPTQELANFTPSGRQGILGERPANYVPFKVAIYDEKLTNAARKLARDNNADPAEVAPIYQWVYRPEMQFSVYDLQKQMLRLQPNVGDAQDIDLSLENSAGLIGSLLSGDIDYAELLYDLTGSEFDPLERFSGDRELVFSIGAEEAQATITPGGIVRFDNPEHLSLLDETDYITISLYQNNDSANILWEFAFEKIHLIADMNHDGQIIKQSTAKNDTDFIDTINSTEIPFLFWVNDDDDEGEIDEGKASESDIPGRSTADHLDDVIDGMRDLVDFFPVYIDIKSALETFPATEYSYRLVHEDSALKFTETSLYPNPDPTKISYEKRRVDAPLKQWDIAAGLIADNSNVKTITPAGIELDPVFLNNILNDEGGIILVEASKATQAPLKLVIVKNSNQQVAAHAELALKISGVEDMYRHIDLKNYANQRGAAPEVGPATNIDEPLNNPDTRTKANYLTFVHGYNVSAQAARAWNAEMFKRFQRLGFNGRFIGVTWHGDTGTDYHHGVYNAFQTSVNLKTFIDSAMLKEPGPLTVVGHSLGNMVLSNAIVQGGLAPDRYFMINAAVPIEAYDATQKPSVDRYADNGSTALTMIERMTEADWAGYPEKVLAANWHELFQANPDDNRNDLKWKNRFSSVLDVTYNFYSSGEEVVENAVEGETVPSNIWARVGDWMSFQGLGRHAWVTQEIAKGCNSWTATFVFECSGGWDFNTYQNELAFIGEEDPTWDGSITDDQYRKYNALNAEPAITNAELTDEELAQFGFFGKFSHYNDKESHYAALYAPINSGGANIGNNTGDAATASALAGENETQWDLLSSGIPAMSFGAAANPVYRLNDFGIDRNIDMQGLREAASVPWPSTLLRVNWNNRWLHSDIKSIALPYVHHTFDKMLEIGEFKE